jgi:nucleoside-diphosphate-sugar epimerase
MLSGKKILITGPAGQIAFPLAEYLAADNEVWGVARFSEAGSQERCENAGVRTVVADLAKGDFGDLPDDFDYLLHLATFQGPGLDYDFAISVNGEGTGLLMQHCRTVKAAVVVSTFSLYKPAETAEHPFKETDPLGDANQPHAPTYSMSKIAEEAVARTMCRLLNVPTTIARMNASYSWNGGLPAYHLDWMMNGDPVQLRAPGGTTYNPIHQDDINEQIEKLLAIATVPATIVNWAGDHTVTPEEWCAYFAELTGKTPTFEYREYPGITKGGASDNTKRLSLIGPCKVHWKDGFRDMWETRYPGGVRRSDMPDASAKLRNAYVAAE